MSVVKGVVLVGGPNKGTRMRPLSLDCELASLSVLAGMPTDLPGPKPLLPIAGKVRHALHPTMTI